MGSGCWSADSYKIYACSTGRGYDENTCTMAVNYSSTEQAFEATRLDESLNPKNIVRECCDSNEHPNTIPIILALDVTGSMGDTAMKIQKLLNPIMTKIYDDVEDAEIAIMAIGDLACDKAPVQMSQFESDIRIADNLDKIYFENGGGGNMFESYTAAWYMGLKHTKLDCWNRGRKGIIITMGDEEINPYLPRDGYYSGLSNCTGDKLQSDIETRELFNETSKKFDLFHICVESRCYPNQKYNMKTFQKVIGDDNVAISSVDNITETIVNAVKRFASKNNTSFIVEDTVSPNVDENGEIGW